MTKTMSNCCAFWGMYICLNEGAQENQEAEAQSWLDWMEGIAEKQEEAQQRTWIGLTDDEIRSIEFDHIRRRDFARAIEAKLKEKNNA